MINIQINRHQETTICSEKKRCIIWSQQSSLCGASVHIYVRVFVMTTDLLLQKYNACNGKFETLSKYDGLKFTAEEFRHVITNFLYDGVRQRREVIQPVYDRLCHFYQCVSQQDTFRFYSSSLLIIYEGQQSPSTPVRVDVRAIDFAHTINESSALQNDKTQVHKGPDKGYLLGIKTLIDMFGELLPKGS